MIEQLKCMIKRYRIEIVFFAVMMVLLSVSELWVGSADTVNKEILQNTPVLELSLIHIYAEKSLS